MWQGPQQALFSKNAGRRKQSMVEMTAAIKKELATLEK